MVESELVSIAYRDACQRSSGGQFFGGGKEFIQFAWKVCGDRPTVAARVRRVTRSYGSDLRTTIIPAHANRNDVYPVCHRNSPQ